MKQLKIRAGRSLLNRASAPGDPYLVAPDPEELRLAVDSDIVAAVPQSEVDPGGGAGDQHVGVRIGALDRHRRFWGYGYGPAPAAVVRRDRHGQRQVTAQVPMTSG